MRGQDRKRNGHMISEIVNEMWRIHRNRLLEAKVDEISSGNKFIADQDLLVYLVNHIHNVPLKKFFMIYVVLSTSLDVKQHERMIEIVEEMVTKLMEVKSE
jgi:hypothetical protein